MNEHFVDGPGCTPVSAGRAAALRILAQAQREQWQPREDEPADIPVRQPVRVVQLPTEDQEDEEPLSRCRSGHLWDEECPQCP